MSNAVTIQRREVKNLGSGQTWLEAHIFDDYGDLDSIIMEPLPKDNLELFEVLVRLQSELGTENIHTILGYMHGAKVGVTIDGEYLDYGVIECVLSNYMKGFK